MEIHWFTFAAQIVNFLILVALLKRFLYGPIVRTMDQREQQIAKRIDDAQRMRRIAEEEATRHRDQQQQLEHQRETLLAQAGQEVEAWRRERLGETREEIQRARQEWYAAVRRQRDALLQELGRRASGQIIETARSVLAQLADVQLEQQIVAAFLKRLAHLHAGEREKIASAMAASHHRITITSSFELSDDQQSRIRSAVHRVLAERSDRIEMTFRTVEELICGVELRAADHKIAWNIQWLLESLEEEFNHALDSAVAREPEPDVPDAQPTSGGGHVETTAGADPTP